jgi:aminopeptidase-like protein
METNKYFDIAKKLLFPLLRSITGKGTLETLKIIKKNFKELKIKNIKSGTKVFDWRIPPQWEINDAYVLDRDKKKIIDLKKNNLHIISYSVPVKKYVYKKDLLARLFSLKKQPSAIPYITSYYKKFWGFCITDKSKKKIIKKYQNKDKFLISIDSRFKQNGNLRYGEYVIKGKSKKEILISTYICHPGMANNELSGPIVAMSLMSFFKKKNLNNTLRFLFIPETIGSIAYINRNFNNLKSNVIGGFNLSCIGDEREHSCMLSKYNNSPSDYSLLEAYKKLKIKYKKYNFLKRGSDERQYNSPGVDLGITSIFRTKYCEYKEYHTSLDDFNLVTKKGIKGGFLVAKTSIEILDKKIYPKSKTLCEPHMSKRNLYPHLSTKILSQRVKDFMNFITYSDGRNDLTTISKYIKKSFSYTQKIYKFLNYKKLVD